MAKYRKKPIIVEATQWFVGDDPLPGMYNERDGFYSLKTPEGILSIGDGDWIITGISGEYYPCNPNIFEQTYEPVEERSSLDVSANSEGE
jgi:hypothetical protein